ncbi:hypothetical protein [Nocardioides alcanivorans]|uniref:hypothetical protein n=1 Tax=Nocardioides alcanivorans TaxID=2897352 RepID=UPI001F1B2B80|nr:hypothetical protein [Nocardioides alcanivorans]
MPFRPGEHAMSRELEPLYEDVPRHLSHQLTQWTAGYLNSRDANGIERIRAIANHMRYDYAQAPKVASNSTKDADMRMYILKKCQQPEEHLRVVEYLLPSVHISSALALEEMLRLANSAYAVSSEAKRLEMRVEPEVKAQVEAVIAAATESAGGHLTNAWNEAYGREADPVKSYSESIKAVEAALAQSVSPQNDKQTLGTMIRDVAAKPAKWEFVIAGGSVGGVETMLSMMRMLWEGQTSRHGGVNLTRDETPEEAKAAVHFAATLVQFGVSGAFSIA